MGRQVGLGWVGWLSSEWPVVCLSLLVLSRLVWSGLVWVCLWVIRNPNSLRDGGGVCAVFAGCVAVDLGLGRGVCTCQAEAILVEATRWSTSNWPDEGG